MPERNYSIPTLAKNTPDFTEFYGHKSTHFSQISQELLPFYSLSKNIHRLILSRNYQNAHNETFAKIPFFANDLAL